MKGRGMYRRRAEMKLGGNLRKLASMLLVSATVLALLAGCEGKEGEGGSAVDGGTKDGRASRDVVGTFHRIEGDVAYAIEFSRDGSFRGNAWGDHREERRGTYILLEQDRGPRVELTFSDGDREIWSAIVAEDRIEALVNPEGDQYTRKP